jgi:uncharacterized protein (TIGR00251 family)
MIDLVAHPRGIIIPVRAHAGARRNAILGARQRMLRVAVTAAPEKGKANRAIIALLSGTLGVPKSAIELVSGETSPQKRFLIAGASEDGIRNAIASATE